jgi:hypothetical protein
MRKIEDEYPWIGALIGALIALLLHWYGHLYFAVSASSLLAAAINVGAIAAGFLATCQSILLSSIDSPDVKRLRRTEHFGRLLSFISNSVRLSFALAAFSAMLIVCDFQKNDPEHNVLLAVWMAVASATGFSYHRSVRVLLCLFEGTSGNPVGKNRESHEIEVDSDILPHE